MPENGVPSTGIDGNAIAAESEAVALGSLSSFDLTEPVSLARAHAAMLPIITNRLPLERVSIYNQAVLADHPLAGVDLHNDGTSTLPAGPLTVYDHGVYQGDASLPLLPAGDHRLLSFAIDLPVLVDATSDSSAEEEIASSISQGVLTISQRMLRSTVYRVEVGDHQGRQLVIEAPLDPDWTLVGTPPPSEITAEMRRWKLDCPGTGMTFTVREESIERTQSALMDADGSQLEVLRLGARDPRIKDALARVLAGQRAIAQSTASIAAQEAARAQIETDQERERSSLQVAGATTALAQRLQAKLLEQETAFDAIDQRLDTLRAELEHERRALQDAIAGMSAP